MSELVSVIIPVFNEAPIIEERLSVLTSLLPETFELILVDGGSEDGTFEVLETFSSKRVRITSSSKGRAIQMNAGAAIAGGDLLLFLHIDTELSVEAIQSLLKLKERMTALELDFWGRFDVALGAKGLSYKVISWFINHRSKWSGIATGDQCIFTSKNLFVQTGCFPDQPLMEDVELSKRLKAQGFHPHCLNAKVRTSARKWQNEGVINTVLLMWLLRARYALGEKPENLVRIYYKT